MNADQLLAHYEKIADAPAAIPRLRRFILDLAVRGKLVPQDPNDEPASELLKRIATEKKRIGRKEQTQNKRRRENSFDSREIALPMGWAAAPLADLVTVLNGRAYKKTELLETGTPVLRVGNLFTSDKWYYSNLELDDDKYCEEGDLIFAWSASFGPFIWSGPRVIYHYHIWKLPLHSEDNLDKLYLYNFLLQKTREIKDAGHGISMIHMTKEKMERLFVPLPPLSEQRRIVAKLDELMTLCDRLEAAREAREATRDRLTAASLARLNRPDPDEQAFRDHAGFALDNLTAITTRPDQIKQLRQTILSLAVRGKLVPQDPNDEQASELLKRIGAEKERFVRNSKIRQPIPTSGNDPKSPMQQIPLNWSEVAVSEIAYLKSGLALKHGEERSEGQFPYLKVADLGLNENANGIFASTRFVGVEFQDAVIERGSIVFPKRGGAIATNKKRRSLVEIVCDSNLMAMKPFVDATTDYIELWFSSIDLWTLNSGTSVPQINNKDIYPLVLPLPPLPEQHRIVAKVDELMALCERLEASLDASAATRRRLLDALLHAALSPETREREAA